MYSASQTHCKHGHLLTVDTIYRYGKKEACKTCRIERCRKSRAENPEYHKAGFKDWMSRNRKKYWTGWLLRRYGITHEIYDKMLADQMGLCAVCRTRAAREVDHNHETGQVRALLCHRCNIMIGFIEKTPEIFAGVVAYLQRWKQ